MEIVKLGKSGQVSIPRAFLRQLGLEPGATMLAELTGAGEVVLRPAGVYPIEIYSDDRMAEFQAEDRPEPRELQKVRRRTRQ